MNLNFTFPENLDVQSIAILILAICVFALWRLFCAISPWVRFHIEASNQKNRRAEDDIEALKKEILEIKRGLGWDTKGR